MSTARLLIRLMGDARPLSIRSLARKSGVNYESVRQCLSRNPEHFEQTRHATAGHLWRLTPVGLMLARQWAQMTPGATFEPEGRRRRDRQSLDDRIEAAIEARPTTCTDLAAALGYSVSFMARALRRLETAGSVHRSGEKAPGRGRASIIWCRQAPETALPSDVAPVGISWAYRTAFQPEPRAALFHLAFTGPLPCTWEKAPSQAPSWITIFA